MRTHSQELQHLILRAVDEGLSRGKFIEQFHISRATIKRYMKQRPETGNMLLHLIPGRSKIKGTEDAGQFGNNEMSYAGDRLEKHMHMEKMVN